MFQIFRMDYIVWTSSRSMDGWMDGLTDGWMDGWMEDVILHPFQQYFRHIRMMGG